MTVRVMGTGRYQSGEKDYTVYPSNPVTPLKLVMFLHGYSGDANSSIPGGLGDALLRSIADAGYMVMCIDGGGPSTWGNATAMTALSNAVTYAQGTLGAASGKIGLFGYSMGGCNAFNWAKANPTKVACIAGLAPVSDLGWQYSSGGDSTYLDTAYAGSYATNGTSHSPSNFPASLTGFPIKAWQGHNDVNVAPSTVQSLVSAINTAGGNASYVDVGAYDHTAVFAALNNSDVVAFLKANL